MIPKLSIITVSFNSEKYIRLTLESVLRQDYQNYEYIIIDGASKDRTIQIVEEYIPRFQGRLRYISEPDNGIYYAMNKGISMANGDYIGIINSDDFYYPGTFSRVVSVIDESDVLPDVIYGNHDVIDEDNNVLYTGNSDHGRLNRRMSVSHPTSFVKRETYQKYGSFDTSYRITADYELMMRFKSKGCVFQKIDSTMAAYRIGGASSYNVQCVKEPYRIQKQYVSFPWAARIYCIEYCKLKVNKFALSHKSFRKFLDRFKQLKK